MYSLRTDYCELNSFKSVAWNCHMVADCSRGCVKN